jgi:hypothetical protein
MMRTEEIEDITMARKPTARNETVLFNVFYEDGSQTSNRKVPVSVLGGRQGDEPAREIIEAQDRDIGERSGRPRAAIKLISRSSKK